MTKIMNSKHIAILKIQNLQINIKHFFPLIGREEKILMPHRKFLIGDDSLRILDVTTEDGGQYICYARNGVGDGIQRKITLSVIGERPDTFSTHLRLFFYYTLFSDLKKCSSKNIFLKVCI